MEDRLSLPPLFEAVALANETSPLSAARAAAEKEDSMGKLFYMERPDRVELALVLAPERELRAALPVLYPLHLALCEALGALLPPQYAVQYGWPDRIYLNGALCGAVALQVPDERPKAEIDWMLVAVTLDVMGEPGDLNPGRERDRTSLYEEGAVDIDPRRIIEAFARYFLSWLTRWEEQGLPPLWQTWSGRALGYDEEVEFPGPKGAVTGLLEGIAREGNLRIKTQDAISSLPLHSILRGEGWRLAGGA